MHYELHATYQRSKVAEISDGHYNGQKWNTGCVSTKQDDGTIDLFLFVTLDKKSGWFAEEHKYADGFRGQSKIVWSSQNRTSQKSETIRRITGKTRKECRVHLFVRAEKKIASVTQPFTYCGRVRSQSMTGNKPVKVTFTLDNPAPAELAS